MAAGEDLLESCGEAFLEGVVVGGACGAAAGTIFNSSRWSSSMICMRSLV